MMLMVWKLCQSNKLLLSGVKWLENKNKINEKKMQSLILNKRTTITIQLQNIINETRMQSLKLNNKNNNSKITSVNIT